MTHKYLSIIISAAKRGISEKHWRQLDLQHYQVYERNTSNNILISEYNDANPKPVFNHITLYVPTQSDGLLSLTTSALRNVIKDNIENPFNENIIFSLEEKLELWANKKEWLHVFKSLRSPLHDQSSVFINDLFIPLPEVVRVLEYSIETGRDFSELLSEEKLRLAPYGELVCDVLQV